jgi:L-ascorbate metabolism protein UlaG (beta-lactamase superfamily)
VTLELDFLGHSTVSIQLDGIHLLTDPVIRSRIGPLRRVTPSPPRHATDGLDAVLISHLHWDHLDVPSLRRLGSRVPIIVPAGSGAWMRSAGFEHAKELGIGDSTEVGGVHIQAVPARHSGFRPPFGPTAPAQGYLIRGSRTVYFAGDTDLYDEMADLAGMVDVALLPVWGWGPTLGRGRHLDPFSAAEALQLIRPRVAVPIHWGTYWPHALGRIFPERLVEPPAAFAEYASELAPDVRVLPTAVGDTVAYRP